MQSPYYMYEIYPYQEGCKTPYIPWLKVSAWVKPRKCQEHKPEALRRAATFPKRLKGCISFLAGMYLINTKFGLFWPEAFRFLSLSISVHSGARTMNSTYCQTQILQSVLGNTPVDFCTNWLDPNRRAQWRRVLWPHYVPQMLQPD